jgi:type II secretory pathway pseudopilin PulG
MTAMPCPRRHPQRGFSYIALLILVVIMGVALAATGELWQTTSKREKEDQLLYLGDQFRIAIGRYFQAPGAVKQYPRKLEDLLLDPRFPNIHRYLRQIPVDPMTGTKDWGLVKGPNDEIMGVFSKSEDAPLKTKNFSPEDSAFEGAKAYKDWQFVYAMKQYSPNSLQPQTATPPPQAPAQAAPPTQ